MVPCLHKVEGVIFSLSRIFILIYAGTSIDVKKLRATFLIGTAASILNMSSIVQCHEAFGHLLKAIHDRLSQALWLVVFDVNFMGADATNVIHL